MKIRTLSMLVVFCELLVAGVSAQTSTAVVYKYAAINYPGANAQSTTASGINNSNVIVGSITAMLLGPTVLSTRMASTASLISRARAQLSPLESPIRAM